MKPGIQSYKEFNKIIIKTLKEKDEDMTARQIASFIDTHYKNNKRISTNPLSIAKRIQRIPEIKKIGDVRGYSIYRYVGP